MSGHVLAIDLFEQESTAASLAGKPRAEDIQQKFSVQEYVPKFQLNDNASVKDRSAHVVATLVRDIQKQVADHGTLDVLRFEGHGMSGHMFYKDIPVSVVDVTHALEQVQKQTGQKIAKKIEFSGCNTFSHLDVDTVQKLRQSSVALGSELVGTTDIEAMGYRRVVSFKNGEVGHFTADTYSSVSAAIVSVHKMMKSELNSVGSDKWAQCHAGKTQDAGMMCQLDMTPLQQVKKPKIVLPRYVKENPISHEESGFLKPLQRLILPHEDNGRAR